MAQQVEIAGVLFNNVPYIQCPDGNGVYHQFLDTTIPSNAASASDITQGKLAYVNGLLVTGTNQGGGGGGLEYETGTWTPASDVADYDITFSKTHTTAPFYYMVCDAQDEYLSETNINYGLFYNNFHQVFGRSWYQTSTVIRYGMVYATYRGSSNWSNTQFALNSPYTSPSASGVNASRYWATSSKIKAYTNSTSRYWKSGHTYKWIAVWLPTS